MGIDNKAILFLGYEQFELVPTMDFDEVDNYVAMINKDRRFNEHGSILYRPLVSIYSSSHEEMLIGFLLGDSGSYNNVKLNIEDILINIPVHRERLRDIFDHKEPKLYLFNNQN